MMLTGHLGDAGAALAKNAGCGMSLTKPMNRERLQTAITQMLLEPATTK